MYILFILFGLELLVLYYVFEHSKHYNVLALSLILTLLGHEFLYIMNKVPVMHWWIPVEDPVVNRVIHYQWIIYGILMIPVVYLGGMVCTNRGVRYDTPSILDSIPVFFIITFVLVQQLYGFFSGYWHFIEPDTARYLNHSNILVTKGFKSFIDIWMLAPDRVHQAHTDLPLIPFIWGVVYKVLGGVISELIVPYLLSLNYHRVVYKVLVWAISESTITDITNHLIALSFWGLSLMAIYLIGKELFSSKVGVYGAMFLALIPYYSYMGYLYMIDIPLTAFVSLCLYNFIRAIKYNSGKDGFIAGLLFTLAFLTKYIGLYIVWLVPLIIILFRKEGLYKTYRPLISFGISVLIWFVLILLVLLYLYGQDLWRLILEYFDRMKYLLSAHMFKERQEYVSLYYRGEVPFFFYFQYLTAYISFGMISLIIVSLFVRYKAKLLKGNEHLFLILWPLTLMIFFSFALTKTDRFIFSAYPALMLLAAYGFVKLKELVTDKRLAYLLLILILVETLGRHISFYYSSVAQKWIISG